MSVPAMRFSVTALTLSKQQILDSPKMKVSADNSFKFVENGRKFSKLVENIEEKEKLIVMGNFSFSHSVFMTYTHENRACLENG